MASMADLESFGQDTDFTYPMETLSQDSPLFAATGDFGLDGYINNDFGIDHSASPQDATVSPQMLYNSSSSASLHSRSMPPSGSVADYATPPTPFEDSPYAPGSAQTGFLNFNGNALSSTAGFFGELETNQTYESVHSVRRETHPREYASVSTPQQMPDFSPMQDAKHSFDMERTASTTSTGARPVSSQGHPTQRKRRAQKDLPDLKPEECTNERERKKLKNTLAARASRGRKQTERDELIAENLRQRRINEAQAADLAMLDELRKRHGITLPHPLASHRLALELASEDTTQLAKQAAKSALQRSS